MSRSQMYIFIQS